MGKPKGPVLLVTDEETLRRIIADEVKRALEAAGKTRPRLLTADEVGERFNVDRRTVLKRAREQGLPSRRLGPREVRFAEAEVDEWAETRRAG